MHAFSWGGSRAVGIFSAAILVPPFACAALVGAAIARWPAHTIRATGLAVQAVAYACAALGAIAGAPTPLVAPFVIVGLATTTIMHPTGATLIPRIARSTDDLISANLWVSHCDSASALIGSLTAAIAGAAGPQAVFVIAALGSGVGFAATAWRPAPLARTRQLARPKTQRRVLRNALVELRARPWSRGVLCVASARNIMVGAFDILLVIVAIDALRMGGSGPGYLSALVGAGALASTLVTTSVVRRARLRGALLVAIAVAASLAIVIGLRPERPVVFLALPVLGVCMASMEGLSRTLLQRSNDPRSIGLLLAALGLINGLAQFGGSLLAQIALAIGDYRAALIALGVTLLGLAALSIVSLRRADESAMKPVVEMTMLSGLPMFSALPTAALEQVARLAESVQVAPDTSILREGESSGACWVIVDGDFEVTVKGTRQRLVTRGDVVGDVALLTNTAQTTSVTALRPSSALRIERGPFLVALTGQDVVDPTEGSGYAAARERYRQMVAEQRQDPRSHAVEQADWWLRLGATGRLLGDPAFSDALARGAQLARMASNTAALAEAAAMATWPGQFFFMAEIPDHEMIDLCETALATLGTEDPIRVRVLATLAVHLTFASAPERRLALIDEAIELARRHADPALLGAALNAEYICLWEPATLSRREYIGPALVEIATGTGDAELEFIGEFFTAYCAAERGRLAEARDRLVGLRDLVHRTHHPYFEFLAERLILSIDLARGEPGVAARIDALAERHGPTHADTEGTWALQVGFLTYQAGTLGTMIATVETLVGGSHTWRAALALAHFMNDDPHAARRTLIELGEAPRNYFWLTVAECQAEVAVALDMGDRCQALFDELSPYRGRMGITSSGSMCFGLVSRTLGELALGLNRWDDAVDLLTEAVRDADNIGLPYEAVITRRLLARAYVALGDCAAAATAIDGALPTALERGFEREARLLAALRELV